MPLKFRPDSRLQVEFWETTNPMASHPWVLSSGSEHTFGRRVVGVKLEQLSEAWYRSTDHLSGDGNNHSRRNGQAKTTVWATRQFITEE
jgi:hypothetical protein